MKVKKLLAGVLSATMVAGTMALPAFADSETDVYTVGAGKSYETFAEALNAEDTDSDGIITYEIYGKVVLPAGSIKLGKDGITTINFTKGSDDAELSLEASGLNLVGFDHAANVEKINYTGLKLSRLNGSNIYDAAHLNQFFTTTIRGKADGIVTYTDCTFPNGSGSNTYGKTVYNNCTFSNDNADTKYNVWIRGGSIEINGGTMTGAGGIKLYCDAPATVFGDTKIDGVKFENITKKPAIVATQQGKIEIKNSTVSNCEYGLIANESNQGADLADITVDGKAPEYVASVGGNLYTGIKYAEKEAAEKGKTLETIAAMVGDKYYAALAAAVEAANAGDTVKLLCNTSGDGIVISKDLTIDFNGFSYTINGTLVGSTGSETNGFQLLKKTNADTPTITFKNGSIISSKTAQWGATTNNEKYNPYNNTGANIIIQNYSNLTLDNVTIDGDQTDENEGNPGSSYAKYVLSNNNGNTVLTGNTNIIAASGKYAFDIFSGWTTAYPSVSVTLDDNMTGTINGNIEISNWDKTAVDLTLKIKNGTVNGSILDNRSAAEKANNPKLNIVSGGTFSTDVSDYCADGFTAEKDETTGQYIVKKTVNWNTDTDSGYYMDGETKYGMMRFMFDAKPSGTVTNSGIKYINSKDIEESVTASTNSGASVFQGDIIKIPETVSGSNKYYAVAYIVTEDGTFWSDPVECSVNWNQYFKDYTPGGTK